MMESGEKAVKPILSVIVPTLNGAVQLRELLASFKIQTIKPDKVLIVDSSSEDDSVAVAEEYGAEVAVIDRENFDHGGTRTFASKVTSSDILIFFTQDVIPANREVIENLIEPLISSETIGVSYGRQLPAFGASEIAAHLRLFNYPVESEVRGFEDRKSLGLQTVFASNSCAAYRRDALGDTGYFKSGLIFGEDTCAVGRILQNGYKIAYAAEAKVYHSHNYTLTEDFRRYFDIGVLHESEKWLLEMYGGTGLRGTRYVRSGISYLLERRRYSMISEFMVRVALKFLGYQLGRRYRKIPPRLVPELSLHRNWWRENNAV